MPKFSNLRFAGISSVGMFLAEHPRNGFKIKDFDHFGTSCFLNAMHHAPCLFLTFCPIPFALCSTPHAPCSFFLLYALCSLPDSFAPLKLRDGDEGGYALNLSLRLLLTLYAMLSALCELNLAI